MKRNIVAAIAVTFSLSLTACGGGDSAKQATPAIEVRTATVQSGSIAATTDFSGSLLALHRATVGALTPGRIDLVVVHAGDRVTAGTVLARVDSAQYSAMLAGARAGASAAGAGSEAALAGLQQAQSRYDLAAKTAQRMGNLYTAGAISKEQRDQVEAQLEIARAGLAQARAQVQAASGGEAAARAGVAAASVPVNDATIAAPSSGVVTQTFVRQGEVVGAGSPVARIESDGKLELKVAIPLENLAALHVGQQLAVHVDALGGSTLQGTIRSLVPSDNPALRSAILRIDLPARPGLLPGMFARAIVPARSARGARIPLSALVERAGQSGVFAVRNGKAVFVPVDSVVSNTRYAIVTGIAGGTTIATSNLAELTDGAAVTVVTR